MPVTDPEHAHTPPSTPTPATTGWGLFWGALVVAVVLLLVGALAWLVFGYGTSHFVDSDAKRAQERAKILADRNAEDYKLLHDAPSFMAKDKGIVRVPIDRAIELTIPELQKVEPHPAYPVKQSPPQPAGAPTSPDKGVGAAEAGTAINPPASNPTVGQPSPAPAVVAAPTPMPPTSASSPVPTPVPAPTVVPSTPPPAPSVPPTPAPTPTPATSAPTPVATPVPNPAATAVPLNTPMGIPAPSPDNNANNPGSPPVPGTTVQTPAPSVSPAVTATPAPTGAQPEPLMTPPSQPTPTGTTSPTAAEKTTPTPAPTEPGASPAGTP